MDVLILSPAANGAFSGWAGDVTDIDEGTSYDSDTTYISNTGTGRKAYLFPNVTTGQIPDNSFIYRVIIAPVIRYDAVVDPAFRTFISRATTILEDGSATLIEQNTYHEREFAYHNDPATSSPWDVANLRTWRSGATTRYDIGVKSENATNSAIRITALNVYVEYTAPFTLGPIAAQSTATGFPRANKRLDPAMIADVTTVNGTMPVTRAMVSSVAAQSVVNPRMTRLTDFDTASVAAVSSVSALLGVDHAIAGEIDAVASVAGLLGRDRPLVATTTAGQSNLPDIPELATQPVLAAEIDAVSTLTGDIISDPALAAEITAVSDLTSFVIDVPVLLEIDPTMGQSHVADLEMDVDWGLIGSIDAVSTISADLGGTGGLVAYTGEAVSTVDAALSVDWSIVSSVSGVSSIAATTLDAGTGALGEVSGVSSVTAIPRVDRDIDGSTGSTSFVNAIPRVTRDLVVSTIAVVSGCSGILSRYRGSGLASAAVSDLNASMGLDIPIAGSEIAARSGVAGSAPQITRQITASTHAHTGVIGSLAYETRLLPTPVVSQSDIDGSVDMRHRLRALVAPASNILVAVSVDRDLRGIVSSSLNTLNVLLDLAYELQGEVGLQAQIQGKMTPLIMLMGDVLSSESALSAMVEPASGLAGAVDGLSNVADASIVYEAGLRGTVDAIAQTRARLSTILTPGEYAVVAIDFYLPGVRYHEMLYPVKASEVFIPGVRKWMIRYGD